ncbi:hypothetical protein ASPZODRAFT_152900 [Penicilliopsis zonata CBS 506.65]|uniref:Dipeptidase n=1 Tax=Penicilliopsis zonata CBS 506.65 TaxID=1073090 RepID=A0A1L9SFA2_9EURO|nr:hypothetical protein ASPZODRAFT_152900 [Penicilliopsis zonata CBS 506.65]OJJ45955.1 hypothetical protein ASPZODRAFT_152900 [Penicilliopsis zonata CBS 506.65]
MDGRTLDAANLHAMELWKHEWEPLGSSYNISYGEGQKWHFLAGHRTDEATLIKIYDSADVPAKHGHNDFPIWIRAFWGNHIYQGNFSADQELYGQVDFVRLQQGGVTGQFWSVYVPCPSDTSMTDESYGVSVRDTLQQIDLVQRLATAYPGHIRPVRTAGEMATVMRKHRTGIASLLGVEGLHQIGNSASVLRVYHQLGVRYITLTHSCHNPYADSCAPSTPLHGGLSPAGEAMVREMNRVGMMVDLSHTSAATQRASLALSKAPVLFSHSSAYALCAHRRNVQDDVLDLLPRNGGLVMINFTPEFLRQDEGNASLADVADHIVYVGERIGYAHVGLGADYDGMGFGQAPRGLEDVASYPALMAELQRRGVAREDRLAVAGGNVLRVLGEVERVAASMADEPLEDDVKSFFTEHTVV